MVTYVEALSFGFPDVVFECHGSGAVYENIIFINGPVPTVEELDTYIIEYTRLLKWKEIQVERDRRKGNGVKVGANWFHSDDSSRIQQIALVIFGANLPGNIMWKTLNGVFVEMTPTLAIQIFQSSVAQDMVIFGVAEQHKAAMIASADPENYDYSAGWPPTYTGSLLL